MAQELSLHHDLSIIVSEEKGNEKQKQGVTDEQTGVLKRHFDLVREAEIKILGNVIDFPATKILAVERGGVNSNETVEAIKRCGIEG